MIDMYKYNNIISDFLDKLDDECRHHKIKDIQKLSKKDNYLLTLLFSCKYKLADIFNCIDDDNWELPDTYLDITPTTDDTITELNDKLYFTCKSNCAECYKKCEECEYYSISYKDLQKVINELKEKNNDIR